MGDQMAARVFSWQGWRLEARGHHQTREIVAAKSKAAAARAVGETDARRLFNLGETYNAEELKQALSEPGVGFWRPLDQHPSDRVWTRAEKEKP
ncbi:MAG: hypothetical protein JRD89_03575 [Deltaproteobacteria bacterium]|nr:hypothetical protein [Deltaproteobacteria bacterium]